MEGGPPVPLPGETVPQMVARLLAEQKQRELERLERAKRAAAEHANNPIWKRDAERIQKREARLESLRKEQEAKQLQSCTFRPNGTKGVGTPTGGSMTQHADDTLQPVTSRKVGAGNTARSLSPSFAAPAAAATAKKHAQSAVKSASTTRPTHQPTSGGGAAGAAAAASLTAASTPLAGRGPAAPAAPASAAAVVVSTSSGDGGGPKEYDPSAGFDMYALDATGFGGDGDSGSGTGGAS